MNLIAQHLIQAFVIGCIIKDKFKGVITSPGLASFVMNAGLGLTTGFLTRKLFAGATTLSPIKSVISTIVEKTFLKNGAGFKILSSFLSRKTDRKKNNPR